MKNYKTEDLIKKNLLLLIPFILFFKSICAGQI